MSLSGSDLPTSILFCRLCQSLYRDPRTLQCLHSFCLECLLHVAPVTGSQGHPALPCPLCGQHTPLTASAGVAGLTRNDFLARMCREYVGEVQKTLITGRSLSPALRQEGSQASVLAGRVPPSQFQYPSPSPQPHPSSPPVLAIGGGYPGYRALSPPHSPHSDSSFYSPRSSWGGTVSPFPGLQSPSSLSSSEHHHVSASEAVLETARRMSLEVLPSRGLGVHRRLSSTPSEVVRVWECLHRKLNSLQSASLQVTYSLETINAAEANWHQRKQDLRRDVQRRSAQLQFFIRRQERLLLAALDAKKTDDSFVLTAERARSELCANLKALMHETDVLRSVLDLASDGEILSLSTLLMGSRVSQAAVTLQAPELRFVIPEDLSLEDMVCRDFGCLTSTLLSHALFTPEDIVQEEEPSEEENDAFSADTSIHVSSTDSSDRFDNGFEDVAYIDDDEEDEEMIVEETLELVDGKMQVVSKRSIPVSKKPHSTMRKSQKDEDSKENVKRGRATEIRRTANSTTPSSTKEPAPHATKRHNMERDSEHHSKDQAGGAVSPSSSSSTQQSSIEKFQNLRESLKQRRRELLLNTALFTPEGPPGRAHMLKGEKRVQSLDRSRSVHDWRRSFSPSAPKRPAQEPSVTAPVIVTPTHADPKDITERGNTKSSTATATTPTSTESRTGAATIASTECRTVVAAPVMTTSLIVSPDSAEERCSRPVRRAISAASDRASKMEYLRETWRKRKELLIQSEGYIPTHPDNGGASAVAPTEEKVGQGVTASQAGPKSKLKQSLRSRFSNLKQALMKNGKNDESSQQAKAADRGSGDPSKAVSVTTAISRSLITPAAQAAAEKKVLRTIESILLKNEAPSKEMDSLAKPAHPGLQDTSPSAKPSMVVKPCPRDPPSSAAVAVPDSATAMPLEPLAEDEYRVAQGARKPGLRVTSPAREMGKDSLQHMRANIRQKKERWRSLSLN